MASLVSFSRLSSSTSPDTGTAGPLFLGVSARRCRAGGEVIEKGKIRTESGRDLISNRSSHVLGSPLADVERTSDLAHDLQTPKNERKPVVRRLRGGNVKVIS